MLQCYYYFWYFNKNIDCAFNVKNSGFKLKKRYFDIGHSGDVEKWDKTSMDSWLRKPQKVQGYYCLVQPTKYDLAKT